MVHTPASLLIVWPGSVADGRQTLVSARPTVHSAASRRHEECIG